MSQESLKDEAARRNITAYQVKKERINDKLIWLKNRVKELEKQNTLLKDENSQLLQDNNELVSDNNLLKLEQFNTTRPRNDSFNISNSSSGIEQLQDLELSTATRIYNDSIPDMLGDVQHSISGATRIYDDSIPDILNNIQYSIPENFVRLAYS